MKIYTSDRFFLPDQPVKVALVESDDNAATNSEEPNSNAAQADQPNIRSEVPKPSETVPGIKEINAEFKIWKEGTPLEFAPIFLTRNPLHNDVKKYPTLAFEIPGNTLAPGIYQIEFARAGQPVAGKEINVLSEEGYKYIMSQVRAEDFFTEGGPEFSIQQAWQRSWAKLLNYSSVATVPQISLHLKLPPQKQGPFKEDYESKFYWRMGSQRFEWMCFHLNRLILDRAIFGAEVHLGVPTTGNFENGEIRLQIRSSFTQSKLTRIPRQYSDPINSIRYEGGNEGFAIHLNSSGDEDHITTAFTIIGG